MEVESVFHDLEIYSAHGFSRLRNLLCPRVKILGGKGEI